MLVLAPQTINVKGEQAWSNIKLILAKHEAKELVNEMSRSGVIEPSSGPLSSPVQDSA